MTNDTARGTAILTDRTASDSPPMTLPRFHVDLPLVVGEPTALSRDVTRHALRALRLRHGRDADAVQRPRRANTSRSSSRRASRRPRCRSSRFDPREAELPWPITVAQGLSSGDLMDWTVEKAVELGAAAIAPLGDGAQRDPAVGRTRSDRVATHWQALAIAASEQCGRNRIATVEPVLPLGRLAAHVAGRDAAPRRSCRAAHRWRRSGGRRSGGASSCWRARGGLRRPTSSMRSTRPASGRMSLGPRVLRTETAGAVAIAMLSALWSAGDGE